MDSSEDKIDPIVAGLSLILDSGNFMNTDEDDEILPDVKDVPNVNELKRKLLDDLESSASISETSDFEGFFIEEHKSDKLVDNEQFQIVINNEKDKIKISEVNNVQAYNNNEGIHHVNYDLYKIDSIQQNDEDVDGDLMKMESLNDNDTWSDNSTDGVISPSDMTDDYDNIIQENKLPMGEDRTVTAETSSVHSSDDTSSQDIKILSHNLLNYLPEGVIIKTEVKEEDIQQIFNVDSQENMITILVPHDTDEKGIKLEPPDFDSEYLDLGQMEKSHQDFDEDAEDDEDFYIIQVQEPHELSALTGGRQHHQRRRRSLPQLPNQQLVKCELCDYHTYDKSNLRKHRLIHTDDKPYSCDECPFICKLPKYLKQHKVTHMTVREFPCSICCHRCRNLTELNRHLKRHMRVLNKTPGSEPSSEQATYCVCRDGCKAVGQFKLTKRTSR